MAVENNYVEETITVNRLVQTIRCDRCGRVVDTDKPENDDLWAQRLEIELNPEQCVHSTIRMDLCPVCLEPIWQAICAALNIDPNGEHRIGVE